MTPPRYNPFLYPACRNGLINIAIIVGLLYLGFACSIASNFLPIFLLSLVLRWVVNVIVYGYFFAYLNQCVIDSAKGGLTAPDSLPGGAGVDDIKEELFWGIIPLVCSFMPIVLYAIFASEPQRLTVLWLLGAGLFLYPMLYLRSIIIGDVTALNPVAILFNIIRFLPGYISIVIGIALVFTPIILIYAAAGAPAASILSVPWFVYSSVVMAHFVGRFYCLRSEKLDWM